MNYQTKTEFFKRNSVNCVNHRLTAKNIRKTMQQQYEQFNKETEAIKLRNKNQIQKS